MTRFSVHQAYKIIQRATLKKYTKDWMSFVHKILELLTIHNILHIYQLDFTYICIQHTNRAHTSTHHIHPPQFPSKTPTHVESTIKILKSSTCVSTIPNNSPTQMLTKNISTIVPMLRICVYVYSRISIKMVKMVKMMAFLCKF